jgi:hypothetical protein
MKIWKRLKRKDMCPVKRRAIEFLERDDVAAVEISEARGAGNITMVQIRAVKGRAFRAQWLA